MTENITLGKYVQWRICTYTDGQHYQSLGNKNSFMVNYTRAVTKFKRLAIVNDSIDSGYET